MPLNFNNEFVNYLSRKKKLSHNTVRIEIKKLAH